MLEAAKQAEVLRLKLGEGLSSRKIAVQLGLNRKAVERVIKSFLKRESFLSSGGIEFSGDQAGDLILSG